MEVSNKDKLDPQVLLTEYREAMASQRSNTNIIYSWTGSIFLVLSTVLFIYGVNASEQRLFFPVMALATLLILVWWGMTETFVFYIGQRLRRISEIEETLGMRLIREAGKEIKALGWKARFVEARFYVRGFSILYVIISIVMSWLKFRWI